MRPVENPVVEKPAEPPPAPPAIVEPAPVVVEKPAIVVEKPRRKLLLPGAVLLGLGVALGGGGLAANLLAVGTRGDIESAPSQDVVNRLQPDFETRRAAAISCYAIGAAVGVVGITPVIVGRKP